MAEFLKSALVVFMKWRMMFKKDSENEQTENYYSFSDPPL